MPETLSNHFLTKHKDAQIVLDAIKAWLAYKTSCGFGVTSHLKTDMGYTPPELMAMTVCWHMGGNPKASGIIIVALNGKVGVTGYIAHTSQVCALLRRDVYTPDFAPACQ